ncbi:cystathionine gamma-lyase-like isoform X2 [Physella acuta]|uniref:cystathionine gamma-lyase-like isoform X2 n=1 Tax=Physella acuta TaxID=109671 RepID=UPI0027DBF1BC|nr:cystathionine gamma-lyase-like isoform X2 [Physella acuta]
MFCFPRFTTKLSIRNEHRLVTSAAARFINLLRTRSKFFSSKSNMDLENFKPFPNISTDIIHEGQDPEQWKSMAVIPPISTSTTFKQFAPAEHSGFEYSRSGNPTRNCLEQCLAASEGAKHGLCFASGLAATMTVTHLLNNGDHVISMDDVYGGTNRYFSKCAAKFGLDISFVDCTQVKNVVDALKPKTRMIWIETPTNPTMKIVDIAAVCQAVRSETSSWEVKPFVVVDNTFMSAYFQRPLALGADMTMHSLSKYMNGHSDVIMGAILLNDDVLAEKLRFFQNSLGAVPSPFDCYLCNRGMKTLAVRMKEHMINGLAVARYLESHPAVERVVHPGLPSHPQYELGKRQMIGYSGMLIFFIKGGLEASKTFLKSVKIFTLAESLGGFESLCELPSLQTHASVPEDQRKKLGISDSLIRLSVGLEDIEDLINDLDQALRAAVKC